MSTSILQNDGLSSMSWQQVTYNQMLQRVSTELEDETKKISEKYDSQTLLLEAQATQYSKLKAGIKNAEISVQNGQEGIDEINDTLLDMRILVGNYADSESKDLLKEQFDEYVDKINRTADLYSKDYNPIGNVVRTDWTPNTISYEKDLASNRTEMTGTYIGSDFYIESDDGTLWVNDPGASNVQQYENFNTENEPNSTKGDGFASTRTGLRLDSYDESTGAITVTVDPENSPTTVTGTIKLGGTELMQSWFYDLDTEEGREKALAAISKAEALTVGAESVVTGMKATVANDMSKADKQLDAINDERRESLENEMEETSDLQLQKQQEAQILQNTFQQLSAQQANYAKIFQSAQTNSTASTILDIIS